MRSGDTRKGNIGLIRRGDTHRVETHTERDTQSGDIGRVGTHTERDIWGRDKERSIIDK